MFINKVIRINNQIVEMVWPENDRECFDLIMQDWTWYAKIIIDSCASDAAVLQAGGNCGLYPRLYSTTFKRVYTFEPDPVNFHCLARNCTSSSIIKFNTALSDSNRFVDFGSPSSENVGMHRIGAGKTQVFAMTIDSLDIQELSLIHLDLEGHELSALEGATDTIARTRPVVAVEVTQHERAIRDLMKSMDYVGVTSYGDPLNYIFVPKERT